MEFFDSHAHYNDEKFDIDREEIINKIYEEGITNVIVSGYNAESSKRAIELSKKYNFINATCGISPNDIGDNIQEIEYLAKEEKIVAIGEIGLDYYWNKENKEMQKEVFIKQIEIANRLELPIVIHSRDAHIDTIDILKNKAKPVKKGVFHCCALNLELIKEALNLGFYISFAGPVTFKNAKNADDAIMQVPLERLLIETDAPYLAPDGFRGTRNDSSKIKIIAGKIANVKQETLEKVAQITYQNAQTLFCIKKLS